MLATNAPKHWPAINAELKPGYTPANHISLAAALQRDLPEQCTVTGVHLQLMFQEGILEVPVKVRDGDRIFAVFVYGRADEDAGRNFSWAHSFMKKVGVHAVYYAPGRLKPGPPKPQWRDFNWDLLQVVEDKQPVNRWAWWQTEQEPQWSDSAAREAMRCASAALDGYETYVFGSLLYWWDNIDKEQRVALPDEPWEALVQGPQQERFVVSVSKERGIRFHFDPNTTSPAYRDNMWRHYASYCETFCSMLKKTGVAKDTASSHPWFTTMDEQTLHNERTQNPQGLRVGGIVRLPSQHSHAASTGDP